MSICCCRGWLFPKQTIFEYYSTTGVDIIITYFAPRLLDWLDETDN